MPGAQKLEYNQLEAGYDFPPSSYRLDGAAVAAYLEAVGETNPLYRGSGLVPPLAVAARAMAALSEGIHLTPGTIHVSQELDFLSAVSINDTLTSRARVSRKQSRGKFHMLTVDLNVFNQKQEPVLAGKTSFILPEG